MKILFCKVSSMKYYMGASENDIPYNGGSFVDRNGYGNEQYNFLPVEMEDKEKYCLGFVETKTTSQSKRNELHIEKIGECKGYDAADSVDDVLVVWCATTDLNETSVVGWYKKSTVYRTYQYFKIDEDIREFNIIAKAENCILLPQDERHRYIWDIPVARKKGYGFGQSLIWYGTEESAFEYIERLVKQIQNYR